MQTEQLILKLLQEVRDEQKSLSDSFGTLRIQAQSVDDALANHAKQSEQRHQQILEAFPANDIDGHRRYHESVIEWRELRNKIVRECLIYAAQAGGLAALGWIAYAVWTALKLELSRG